jgi:hypothetical protein
MRRVLVLGFAIIIIAICPSPVRAHSPEAIEIEYDYASQELTFVVTHIVDDPNEHYIYSVYILKNHYLRYTCDYDTQTNSITQIDTVVVNFEIDEKLSVIAFCNQDGAIRADMTVEMGSSDGKSSTTTSTSPTNLITSTSELNTTSTELTNLQSNILGTTELMDLVILILPVVLVVYIIHKKRS